MACSWIFDRNVHAPRLIATALLCRALCSFLSNSRAGACRRSCSCVDVCAVRQRCPRQSALKNGCSRDELCAHAPPCLAEAQLCTCACSCIAGVTQLWVHACVLLAHWLCVCVQTMLITPESGGSCRFLKPPPLRFRRSAQLCCWAACGCTSAQYFSGTVSLQYETLYCFHGRQWYMLAVFADLYFSRSCLCGPFHMRMAPSFASELIRAFLAC